MADVFIGVDDGLALAGLHREGDDLVLELAGELCRLGLVLRGEGEFVLHLAGDLPLRRDVLRGLAHVIAVEGVPQPVLDHRVDEFQVAHFLAGAQMRGMGAERHAFLAAGDDDLGVAAQDVLGAERDRAQTRTADLVDAPGGRFDRQAGLDMRLAGRVLALGRGQHLAEDGFRHFALLDAGTGNDGLEHGRAQLMGRNIGERAVETADGGARRRDDHDIGHGFSPHRIPGRGWLPLSGLQHAPCGRQVKEISDVGANSCAILFRILCKFRSSARRVSPLPIPASSRAASPSVRRNSSPACSRCRAR